MFSLSVTNTFLKTLSHNQYFANKMYLLLVAKDYSTFLMIMGMFVMFIIPAILTGGGGARLRLPFEHILFIYGLSVWMPEKIYLKS